MIPVTRERKAAPRLFSSQRLSVVHWAGRVALALGVALAVVGFTSAVYKPGTVTASTKISASDTRALLHPDAACARCHAEIYRRYEQTSMARGSGLALDGALTGELHHAPSSVNYRLFERSGALWMSFARAPNLQAGDVRSDLKGERKLLYFIGSGHRGRTYLYEEDGQWFELPIKLLREAQDLGYGAEL